MDTSLTGILKGGSASMWIIVACSVIALAVALERAIAVWGFAGRARAIADAVARALYRGDLEDARAQCERSGSPAADVFLAALVAAAPGAAQRGGPPSPEKIAAAVERQRQQANLKLRRNLWILGTVGATAPFIGLFGTVVGIMRAFRHMALAGQGGFAVVAAGISEALVTTAGGIAVAIEAVVIYNFFNTHVSKLALLLKLLAEEYLEIVRDALPVAPAGATGTAGPRVAGER
ncbi:MAG TPA: MotA/TolQ/ExbB proton channel family protein [Anaeromyxobacteraceae bacterium]|nr:MotA/TolQ/ExbB proton channel family protein [Anaeromyxobacteraceae bacterium]